MCGIAGYVGFDASLQHHKIGKMLDIQSHRGPDARGTSFFEQCALGHLRLSIIDLTEGSNQPFCSNDGRYTISYNGEIFNYKELKVRLESLGCKFVTKSDTEVLLQSWITWGNDCLSKLIGMYAFAIWDDKDKKLFCARDRFGIKPFNYTNQGGEFWFSSEIKGLLATGIDRSPDMSTWLTYLSTAHYDHTSDTFFNNIKRLSPGHYMEVTPGNDLKITRYWFPPEPFSQVDSSMDYQDACHQLRSLLLNSIDIHLRADVPCGILVSGGVDSAIVVSGSQQAGYNNVHGFHHYFPDPYSELPWVKELVNHYDVNMHYYELMPSLVETNFNYYMWHLEEPFGSLVMLALGPLYAKAREYGIRVFLDGNGADDIFGGYRQHQIAYLADLKMKGNGVNYDQSVKEAALHWGENKGSITKMVDLLLNDTMQHRSIDMTMPISSEIISANLKNHELINSPDINSHTILGRNMIKGLTQTKIPRNTRFDDRLSMSFSNEQRVPLLDHRLSEFVSTIPPNFLFNDGRPKSILRDSMRGLVPDEVLFAKKREVQSPQREWLGKPLQMFVSGVLNSESFADRGFINVEKAKKYYENYLKETPANSFALWQWINLEMWHRMFIDSSLDNIMQQPQLVLGEQGFNVNCN